MRTLTLRNRFQGNSTIVENDFIDYYMTKANGEYVKVYLLLLRHLNTPDSSLTISKLADMLWNAQKKTLSAHLTTGLKMGLLVIDYDDAGTICGLAIGKTSVTFRCCTSYQKRGDSKAGRRTKSRATSQKCCRSKARPTA